MYLDHKFGLSLSLSEITLLFDLSLYLDRTLAQRKAQRKAKSKVKVTRCLLSGSQCCTSSDKQSYIVLCRWAHWTWQRL